MPSGPPYSAPGANVTDDARLVTPLSVTAAVSVDSTCETVIVTVRPVEADAEMVAVTAV